jgi:hypothetical protein
MLTFLLRIYWLIHTFKIILFFILFFILFSIHFNWLFDLLFKISQFYFLYSNIFISLNLINILFSNRLRIIIFFLNLIFFNLNIRILNISHQCNFIFKYWLLIIALIILFIGNQLIRWNRLILILFNKIIYFYFKITYCFFTLIYHFFAYKFFIWTLIYKTRYVLI